MKLDRFRDPSEAVSFPMTAMIDVLFLMIIFLVLGANFEPLGTVELPEAAGRPLPEGVTRLEIDALGRPLIGGQRLSPEKALEALRRSHPREILLLPDRRLDVGTLFRWYDRLTRQLGVPVRVGVTPPSPQ